MRHGLSVALIACGAALLAFALYRWVGAQLEYRHQDQEMAALQQYVAVDSGSGSVGSTPVSDASSSTAPVIDWAGLSAASSDIVGWIEIPGTAVSYPVFQGPDNDYWLRRGIDGKYSIGGQIFLDADDAAPGMVDQQSVVYGHHLKDGTMFKAVADLDQKENFDATDTVWYCTRDHSYELEPLLVYYTQPDDGDARQASWDTEAAFHAYLSGLLQKSVQARPSAAASIDKVSHVLTLVTCNYYDGYGRTLVVCAPKSEIARP